MANRSSLLLVFSLLLFIISFVILCTWGYNTYYKRHDDKIHEILLQSDSAAFIKATKQIASVTRDSLQQMYKETINRLDIRLDSTIHDADSLRGPLDAHLDEFFQLRKEIVNLLRAGSSDAGLVIARQKIILLQRNVDDLANKNKIVEQENKRLHAMLQQVTTGTEVTINNTRILPLSIQIPSAKKAEPDNVFIAYDLRLAALMVIDDKETETYDAVQTDKLTGSFIVKNNNSLNNFAEMIIVILKPDGKVLQKSAWESGTFETREGRKIYSCKMRFDYTKGEPKKLIFSLSSDTYPKGNYTMQVYYNGLIIGKTTSTLS